LIGRVHALSDAHGLVRRSFSPTSVAKRVELNELIVTVLRPYRTPSLNGPDIGLGEQATNNIALVMHELATNAAKYGALSVDDGRVDITWKSDTASLDLTWREHDGPVIAAPAKKGFGSTLMERTILGYGGTLDHDWSPQGLTVRIKIPMDSLAR
jgi:two-component sensor histidine kinase